MTFDEQRGEEGTSQARHSIVLYKAVTYRAGRQPKPGMVNLYSCRRPRQAELLCTGDPHLTFILGL